MEVYRYVALLRQREAAFHTQHVMFLPGSDYVLAIVRFNPDDSVSYAPYLTAVNFGPDGAIGVGTDEVIVSGVVYREGWIELDSKTGSASNNCEALVLIQLSDIRLEMGQAVVLRLTNTHKDEL